MGFVYFYDYSFCTVYDQYQFKGVNQGIRDIEIFKDFIIMLGYASGADNSRTEIIFVFKIFIDDKSEIRTSFTDIFVAQVASDQTRLLNGVFFLMKYKSEIDFGIMVISKSQLRIYTKDMNVTHYSKVSLNAVSANIEA